MKRMLIIGVVGAAMAYVADRYISPALKIEGNADGLGADDAVKGVAIGVGVTFALRLLKAS